MDLASGQSLGPFSEYRQLQIGSKNSCFHNAVGTSSALEALRDALYKLTTTATNTWLVMALSDATSSSPPAALAFSVTVRWFKVATLEHQALFGRAPGYLADDCCLVTDACPRNLEFGTESQLDVRRNWIKI